LHDFLLSQETHEEGAFDRLRLAAERRLAYNEARKPDIDDIVNDISAILTPVVNRNVSATEAR